ncbi:hypothetical protein C8Q79DRAFT_1014450 [Trametes meyenii]|nr:hypothetical protein C8Q79DRAFT_1014450 [Trametes meyenii]
MSSWPFSSHSSGTRAVAHFLTHSSYPPQAPPPPQTKVISSRPQALKIRTRKRARSHVVSPDPTPPQLRPRQQHADAIHSLPPEILTEILLFSASLEYPFYKGFLPPALPLKFMLVCRRWHGLVLATAKFWRSIEMTPELDRISLLLERSGDCPLDVRICHPWAVDPEAVALLVPHAHRVRSVVARLSLYKGHFEMIRPLFDAGMPLLEQLELVPVDDTLRRRGTPAIDFGLSSSTTPLLTSLVVGHVALPYAPRFWQTLRVLKVHTRPWEYLGEREGQRFLDVLAQNPLLEELYVWVSLGTPPDGLPHEGRCLPTMQLPRLRVFSMNGTSASLSFLLPRIQIPPDIPSFDLRIACDAPSEAGHILPMHFRPILDRMTAVTLTQWSCEGKLTLASPHSPWPHTVRDTLTIGLSSSAAPLYVQDMARVLSFVALRSLALRTFDGFPRQDAAAWADFLEAYPELYDLRLAARHQSLEGISTLVEALQPLSFYQIVTNRESLL